MDDGGPLCRVIFASRMSWYVVNKSDIGKLFWCDDAIDGAMI